eukprot:855178-Pyramimonas_sp.AAC.1
MGWATVLPREATAFLRVPGPTGSHLPEALATYLNHFAKLVLALIVYFSFAGRGVLQHHSS